MCTRDLLCHEIVSVTQDKDALRIVLKIDRGPLRGLDRLMLVHFPRNNVAQDNLIRSTGSQIGEQVGIAQKIAINDSEGHASF